MSSPAEPTATPTATRAERAARRRRSPEGGILRLGLLLAIAYLFGLALASVFLPTAAPVLGAMTALNLVVGRAAGMAFGYAGGLDSRIVIPVNMVIESIQVLTIYPLFVFSWRHLLEIQALKKLMARVHQAAEARHETIQRYGVPGLFVFVFIPFWMTGPVVGSVLGFFLGLRPWANMAVVLISTYVAILIWAVLLRSLSGWAATHHQYAPFALVSLLVLVILGSRLLRRRFRP